MLENQVDVQVIVDRVVERLLSGGGSIPREVASVGSGVVSLMQTGRTGLFVTVAEAVSAAKTAQKAFVALPLAKRKKIIAEVRKTMLAHVDELSRLAVEELKR